MDKHDPRRTPSDAELKDVQDNWVDEYAPDDKHEADYFYGRTNQVPVTHKKKHKKWPWVVLIILILGAGGGAYAVLHPKQTAAPASTQMAQKTTAKPQTTETKTKPFTSATYGLTLDVPTDWTIRQSKNNADPLILISPEITVQTTPNTAKAAHMQITFTNKQTTISAFKGDPATAILDSEKLTYTQPSQSQRAQTYLSYLAYGVTDGGIDAAYVTGDHGYQLDQSVPESDIVQSDPLITVTFIACEQADCSGTSTPLNVNPAKFESSALHTQLVKLLSSLQLAY